MQERYLMYDEFISRLSYNKETGILTWISHPKSLEANIRMLNTWISRCLGKRAGNSYKKKEDKTRYRKVTINGKGYKEHHIIWVMRTGKWPIGIVDHIDGDGENNKWSNLRLATVEESARNMPKKITNTSGVTGVSWSSKRNKWIACIWANGGTKYLGGYLTLEEATRARKDAEVLYGFHPNHGR